jgi:hypothetical protein
MQYRSQVASYKCFHRIRRCLSIFDTDFVSDIRFGYWGRSGSIDNSDDLLGSNRDEASEQRDDAVFAADSSFENSISQ